MYAYQQGLNFVIEEQISGTSCTRRVIYLVVRTLQEQLEGKTPALETLQVTYYLTVVISEQIIYPLGIIPC